MTVPAVHCEARKVSYRQTKEGLVVAFVIHPNDMPDALAVAPLGQRYMLALAAIGDDEQPIDPELRGDSQRSRLPVVKASAELRPGVETGSSPTARARASEMGKERYREATPSQQALTRANMLPDDERFRAWIAQQDTRHPRANGAVSEEAAAQFIRDHCCRGATRAHIDVDPEAYRKFLALETMFKIAVGELPEMRS